MAQDRITLSEIGDSHLLVEVDRKSQIFMNLLKFGKLKLAG